MWYYTKYLKFSSNLHLGLFKFKRLIIMKNFLFVLSVLFFCSCGTPGECGGITVDYDKEKGSISYGGGPLMYKGPC